MLLLLALVATALAAPGSIDPSFGGPGGVVDPSFNGTVNQRMTSSYLEGRESFLVAAAGENRGFITQFTIEGRAAPEFDIDSSGGTSNPFLTTTMHVYSNVRKLLLLGYRSPNFLVATVFERANSTYTEDTSYGMQGRVIQPLGSGIGQVRGCLVQPNLDTLCTGFEQVSDGSPATQRVTLYEMKTQGIKFGAIDFGTEQLTPGNTYGAGLDIVKMSDETYLLLYSYRTPVEGSFGIARLNSTFGLLSVTPYPPASNGTVDRPTRIVRDPVTEDVLVLLGEACSANDCTRWRACRLNCTGGLVSSFGDGGCRSGVAGGMTAPSIPRMAHFQPDGKIIITGSATLISFTDTHLFVTRILSNSDPDRSFGEESNFVAPTKSEGYSSVLLPNGKLFVVGVTLPERTSLYALLLDGDSTPCNLGSACQCQAGSCTSTTPVVITTTGTVTVPTFVPSLNVTSSGTLQVEAGASIISSGAVVLAGTLNVSGVVGATTVITGSSVEGTFDTVIINGVEECSEATQYSSTSVLINVSACGSGLSTGAIIGIAVGGAVFGALIILLVILLMRYCRNKRTIQMNQDLKGAQLTRLHG